MKSTFPRQRLHVLFLMSALAVGGTGCASLQTANRQANAGPSSVPPAAAATNSGAAGPSATRPDPSAPRPFDEVVKGAKQSDGLFVTWQKDEKVWLELKPEDFGKPFFFSPKLSQGIGEAGVFGGTMISGLWSRFGKPQVVEFQRVHNQVQLVARNGQFLARAGSPEARAVQASFSASLLASSVVASGPHRERKSVLVDANALFLGDLLGLGMTLQQSYRQGYALDPRHTSFSSVRTLPDQVVFNVRAHYATANLAVPPPGGPPGMPVPTLPLTLPDARSMFIGLYYSIAKLPDEPMRPRAADARVGFFQTVVDDFSDDLARSPRQRYLTRWRLEKKDPAAPMSEPVRPITFWLDRTVPVKYREAITKGVLAWNDAFERIGFKEAIVVKVQPDDATFDTLDVGVASIRWMTNAQPRFGAIGPSQIDPRSGEILDADIGFESLSSRALRATRSQIIGSAAQAEWLALLQAPDAAVQAAGGSASHAHGAECRHAEFAAEQLGYALDVLESRGEIDPASPEAQRFVLDYLTDTTMHEVGHTLGLRHNFRSSTIYTDAEMADPEFTRTRGLAGSVMEYAPVNLGAPGAPPPSAFQTVLGPYDYWAIEYAYKPIDPADEPAELARIAGRSAEPALAYGTDEDNGIGLDPETLVYDLGDDPVAFAQRRLAIARDLILRQETRPLKPEQDYSVLRRAVAYAVRDAARSAGVLQRQIGGLRTLRDHAGSGRDPLQPVPGERQRRALEALSSAVFSPAGLQATPGLQRRLAPNFLERGDSIYDGSTAQNTDFSPSNMVLDLQRALLGQLMSDGLAARILDNQHKVDSRRPAGDEAFRLSELYARLTRDIWSELGSGADISGTRRELQREHLNRLANLLLRPASYSRADARGLVRVEAQALMQRLDRAAARGSAGMGPETRAHLADSADTLRQALGAKLPRSSV
ncbi:MAG: zinc-dependent metalloprotease [Ideonella sp.]|nr:zinc-dependent metalloprotease [Ideonella sp.]